MKKFACFYSDDHQTSLASEKYFIENQCNLEVVQPESDAFCKLGYSSELPWNLSKIVRNVTITAAVNIGPTKHGVRLNVSINGRMRR